jgi:hypothetical protein
VAVGAVARERHDQPGSFDRLWSRFARIR